MASSLKGRRKLKAMKASCLGNVIAAEMEAGFRHEA